MCTACSCSANNKQLLDLFTMICKTIIVEVRVISQAKGKVNNSYLNIVYVRVISQAKGKVNNSYLNIVYYAFQTQKKTNPLIVLYISSRKNKHGS